MMPFGGIAFDGEILPFDVTEVAQFLEKCAPGSPAAGFGEKRRRDGWMEQRDAGDGSLLRPCRQRRGSKQQSGCEFSPPHCNVPRPEQVLQRVACSSGEASRLGFIFTPSASLGPEDQGLLSQALNIGRCPLRVKVRSPGVRPAG